MQTRRAERGEFVRESLVHAIGKNPLLVHIDFRNHEVEKLLARHVLDVGPAKVEERTLTWTVATGNFRHCRFYFS